MTKTAKTEAKKKQQNSKSAKADRKRGRTEQAETEPQTPVFLCYVTGYEPGITREPDGDGFRYLDAEGKQIEDESTLARIKALAIPPAWTEVWICASPAGHIQATGRDAKGRKQYRYHAAWHARRSETKFDRMIAFGEMLPGIRAQTERDLNLPGMPREKVLATVVRLLEATLIRVGNIEYAKANRSYGLTTLRDKHVEVQGQAVQFSFKGKSGVRHTISIENRKLAQIVKRCRELPGQELFQYVDNSGQRHAVMSADVNSYLREITSQEFSAKDFRTWGGTVLATTTLRDMALDAQSGEGNTSKTALQKHVTQAVKCVAEHLGNTQTICKKYYIHPAVLEAFLEGTLLTAFEDVNGTESDGLRPEEQAVMRLLRREVPAAVPIPHGTAG